MSENLIVSRDDVSLTEIQEFPFEDKFFKLPIDKFTSKITDVNGNNIELTAPQIGLVNAIQNPKYRAIVAVFSRRVGKTAAANWIANILSLEPNKSILIISPNYSLSQISWDIQIDLYNRFEIKLLKKNAKDRVLLLENNSSIRMTSANQVDNAIGRSYDLILCDEAAVEDKLGNAYSTQLRPTLDKMNAKVIFISTPRSTNYFKDFYERGYTEEYAEWCSLWCNWKANPRASKEDIAQAKKSMSHAEFAQEFLASFSVVEGQVYEFDIDNDVIDFNKDYRDSTEINMVIMGLDVGYRDPTAACVIYLSDDIVYVVDEYYKAEVSTSTHAKELNYYVNQHDVEIVVIDSAAAQFKADLYSEYDLPSMNAKKDVLPGIEYVKSLIENHRVKVDKSCTVFLSSILQYRWDPNPNLIKPKVLHKGSDIMDAFRYALYTIGPGNLDSLN